MPARGQSGLAAGAQAGAAFGPWGAAIGGAAGLASDIAMAPETGISSSGGGQFDLRSFMDGSGWTVSTGKSTATGSTRREVQEQGLFGGGGSAMPGMSMAGFGDNPLMLLLLLGFGYAIWKQKH